MGNAIADKAIRMSTWTIRFRDDVGCRVPILVPAAIIFGTIAPTVLPSVAVAPVCATGLLQEVVEEVGGAGMVPHDIHQGVGATLTRRAVVGQVAFDTVGVDRLAGTGSCEGRDDGDQGQRLNRVQAEPAQK